MAGHMAKKIKKMEKDRAATRVRATPINTEKVCPGCGANIKSMTSSQKATHIARCVG